MAVNRSVMPLVDVLIGNEEDFSAALGFTVGGVSNQYADLDLDAFKAMIRRVVGEFPNLRLVATTLRHAKTATVNDWSAICWADGEFFESMPRLTDAALSGRGRSGSRRRRRARCPRSS